jgi:dTDP-4-amino-4,6-dideoxygalactose transaminase
LPLERLPVTCCLHKFSKPQALEPLSPPMRLPTATWLTETEHLSKEIVIIPCLAEMKEEEVSRVIAAVNGW